jgi:hypothetical protein
MGRVGVTVAVTGRTGEIGISAVMALEHNLAVDRIVGKKNSGVCNLFEEPGTLEHVAALARDWLIDHLSRVAAPANP